MSLLTLFAIGLYMAGHGMRGLANLAVIGSFCMIAAGVTVFVAALV